jgi:hypothetical protein
MLTGAAMRVERCPKCKAAASVPLVSGLPIPSERLVVNDHVPSRIGRIVHVGKQPANTLCIGCCHRWHSEYRIAVR